MSRIIVCIVLVLAFFTRSAHADTSADTTERVWDTHSSVALQFGFGTSYGLVGVEYEFSPLHWLAFAAGGGQGANDQQLAAAVRIRKIVNGHAALGISIGPGYGDSNTHTGPLVAVPHNDSQTVEYNNVLWLNAEAYLEIRYQSGFFVRAFGGYSQSISWDTPDGTSGGKSALIRPSFGGAIGLSF